MLLIVKIGSEELKYTKDINDCLIHNMENPVIGKIIVFSDLDIGIKIDQSSKKVLHMKMDLSHYDTVKYAMRTCRDYMIYSNPFVKFGNDLITTMATLDAKKSIRLRNSFYIVKKGQEIFPMSSLDDIFGGSFLESKIQVERNGYFIGQPDKAASWCISRIASKHESAGIRWLKKREFPVQAGDIAVEEPASIPVKSISISKEDVPISSPVLIENIAEIIEMEESKLDVIIVSVDYSDLLILTLMSNVRIFDNITVITSKSDEECMKICEALGVSCYSTDCMYDDGASFNKAKAINFGISKLKNPEFVLLLDSDIIVREKIDTRILQSDFFYYCDRYMIEDYDSYRRYAYGNIAIDSFPRESHEGLGYFQLFNYSKRNVFPESSSDAAWSDIHFRNKFLKRERLESAVIHLGKDKKNWNGRVTEKFISHREYSSIFKSISGMSTISDNKKPFLRESKRDSHIKPKLAVITTFFNPNDYINLKRNYMIFSEKIKEKCDLFPIELSFNGEFFIEDENSIRISGNDRNIMWQKERLLNLALERLPKKYTNVAWIDCDILFENEDWVEDCNEMLQKYKVVQLYQSANRLGAEGRTETRSKGIISRISQINKLDVNLSKGIPGFAWAIRRECIDRIKYLDTQIIGGADSLMFYSFFGVKNAHVSNQMNKEWFDAFSKWSDLAFSEIDSSVGFVAGEITHLYHGQMKNRSYNTRYEILSEAGFDPEKDLAIDKNGLWKFKRKEIPKKLSKYFESRDEDDNIIDINSYFDKVFVLNLDRKPERMKAMIVKLKSLKIEFEKFSAIDGNNLEFDNSGFVAGRGMIENRYALACLQSHLEIIKMAKEKNYRRILILEDDVMISRNIKVHLQKIKDIPGWKMLYLGTSQYDWNLEFREGFFLCRKSLGTFAYAIDESIYDEVILMLEKKNKSIDNILSDIQAAHYGECIAFYPNICVADVSDSDIREKRDNASHSEKMRWNLMSDYI